ncbi:PQQ-binding-like beta-propeller repeat protein [Mitsuaria sp. GD03876]|uniref:outer membrane protein assembly factor BamB family protein n=1 Tax=Mitsuaria sp. GD03876 TaxID=2975399 RepID=UPI00244AB794|nr:PQQ-binding-like beta-propeller repeat protein [Mitsuaria sp. GD03876]MDH0864915.1 PQQ-binding-like beta-propeller repeat protein [Mitsuaria sp. GD03876]
MTSTIGRRLAAAQGWRASATALLALTALAGCGGSDSGAPPVEDIPTFALDRDTFDCKAAPEASCDQVTIYATPVHLERRDRTPFVYVRSVDGATGIPVQSMGDMKQLPDGRWQMSFRLAPDRPAGVYVGAVHVDLPPDLIPPAGKRYRGARLNYRLEVTAVPTATTPLPATVAGATPWSDAAPGSTRSGYVPVSLDASKFSRRWMAWLVGATDTSTPGLPALVDGQILVPQARVIDGATGPNALALSESDGKPQWTATIAGAGLTHVVPAGGRAVWSSLQATTPGTLPLYSAVSTNRTNGAVLATRSLNENNPPRFWLATDDTLYLTDAITGEVAAVNPGDLQTRWTAKADPSPSRVLPVHGQFGATVADGVVYTHSSTTFRAFRATDGGQLLDVTADGGQSLALKLYESQTPVIADANTVLAMDRPRYVQESASANAGVQALARADGSVRWTVRAPFRGLPVTANGVVYLANQGNKAIEARSLADGSVLWSWPMDAADRVWQQTMVLTDTHLFVSTDRQTVAIDLATHQAVWRYSLGGWLGMSQRGTLLIVTTNTATTADPMALTAVTLR